MQLQSCLAMCRRYAEAHVSIFALMDVVLSIERNEFQLAFKCLNFIRTHHFPVL